MSGWVDALAPAKLNLALVVGPLRSDGKHEVVTVLERLSLADTLALREADATTVTGFADDTLVRAALEAVCAAAETTRRFEARLVKRVPVAAGLGGGSSDAATALELANRVARVAAARPLPCTISRRASVPTSRSSCATAPSSRPATGRRSSRSHCLATTASCSRCRTAEAKSSTRDVYAAFDDTGRR